VVAPVVEPVEPVDLTNIFGDVLAADPDRLALVVGDDDVSYRDLERAVASCASSLAARGIGLGDRIAVVAAGGLLSTAVLLGAMRIGAAAALMNVQLKPSELRELVEIAGCAAVGVADDAYRSALDQAVDGAVLGARELLTSSSDVAPADAATPSVDEVSPDTDDAEADAMVLFTSGTTGLPKPIPISRGTLARRLGVMVAPFDADAAPVIGMMCVPVFHVGGSLGLLGALHGGRTTVVQPRFDAGEWLRLVERHRISSAFLVPTMLQRILDHPDFATTDLSSVRALYYGAAAAPVALVERAMAAMPDVAFANIFGQTETLGAYTTLTPADHFAPERIGSVGRVNPGVEVRIVDPVTEEDVAAGEVGELWVLADQTVQPGWLRTGDLARQDEDGYLYPSGRLSDTINRGGEKFGPIEIENVLRRHPSVDDVAAVGVPDTEMGERVGVAIVARGPLTADEVKAYCKEHLAIYKVPERVVFVDRLPYSETGKVVRRQLVELIESRADAGTG
jgi:acyl-CoA synthetase (AMP-forming)/AMP-acid ligase II